jgi:hypothetical protein
MSNAYPTAAPEPDTIATGIANLDMHPFDTVDERDLMDAAPLKPSEMGTSGLLQWIAAGEARLTDSKRPGIRAAKTARASAARIMTAALWAGAATLAALAWTGAAAASARWTDEATAKAAGYILHDESCTVGDIHHAPRELHDAVWSKWTARLTASARNYTTRDRNPAASARVLDFARGHTDTVDERDLMDASPAAIRAAVDSGRLD